MTGVGLPSPKGSSQLAPQALKYPLSMASPVTHVEIYAEAPEPVFRGLVMTQQTKRIAVNFGGGYVPGLNAVIAGTVLASSELGWEVFGIQDGYDGLLFPDRYPGGGLVRLTPRRPAGAGR